MNLLSMAAGGMFGRLGSKTQTKWLFWTVWTVRKMLLLLAFISLRSLPAFEHWSPNS
jgi:hypothetical protein